MGYINNKWIGGKLRSLRMSKQLSQEAVATDLGLSLTGYANIEQGKTNISFDRLAEITDYFNISIPSFFNLEEPDAAPLSKIVEYDSSGQSNAITSMQKEISYLKELIKEKNKIIALLEKEVSND